MAVPKKRTSRMKRNIRKSNWKRKVLKHVLRSISFTKSIEKKKQADVAKLVNALDLGPS